MGHTVSSQRQIADRLIDEFRDFGKSLRKEDSIAFERLISKSFKHFSAISYTCSYNAGLYILLAMLLEQEKSIMELEETNESIPP